VVVATIEKNSRERFEVALRRRAGGCIRVELRVREQNGLREWKDGPLTISIDPELTAQISEAFIQARELAAKSEWARGVAQLEFRAAKERRQR
jgi:hypothetical protein